MAAAPYWREAKVTDVTAGVRGASKTIQGEDISSAAQAAVRRAWLSIFLTL
jgi:hypothetical protein